MYARSIQQLSLPELQAAFLSLWPRIVTHARFIFRDVECDERKADCIRETLALAWKWFLRLVEKGKDPPGSGSCAWSRKVRTPGVLRASSLVMRRALSRTADGCVASSGPRT
jgi:hypothetical protein